jgi:hypothetical protein
VGVAAELERGHHTAAGLRPRGEDQTRGENTLAGRQTRASAEKKTCDHCFFRARNLCALGLDEPCPTFRPDSPHGLMPPRQPALLIRDAAPQAELAAQAA